MFHVGQRVECVDDSTHRHGGSTLRAGRVYTVTGLSDLTDGSPALFVAEARHVVGNVPFLCWRFRPVVEKKKKTDISVFQEILRRESIDNGPVVQKPRVRAVSERSEADGPQQ